MLLHVPPAVPVGSLNVVLVDGQIVNVPEIAPAIGVGLTVTTTIVVQLDIDKT